MSETTTPGMTPPDGSTPDTTPTEALHLADQAPPAVDAVPTVAAPRDRDRTRTILEVIGGVVAAALIVVSGAVGFAVGHATGAEGDGRFDLMSDQRPDGDGVGGRGHGAPMAPGEGGSGERGVDPDGDDWLGGGQGRE